MVYVVRVYHITFIVTILTGYVLESGGFRHLSGRRTSEVIRHDESTSYYVDSLNPTSANENSGFHRVHAKADRSPHRKEMGLQENRTGGSNGRRRFLQAPLPFVFLPSLSLTPMTPVHAYEPDPDKLRESLYLISRVQEATVLQERYINRQSPPIQKMKLTLRLVSKSYRLLDQINYVSNFLANDSLVQAVEAGNEAADELQSAIDFVFGLPPQAQKENSMTPEQKKYLLSAMKETREKLFVFLDYIPDQKKLEEARMRVEDENRLNVEEYDGDADAGVYNPVVLPWKMRQKN